MKLVALTDRSGKYAHFTLAPGNAAEANELEPLLQDSPGHISRLLADKAYDSGPLRDDLTERGIEPVIPARSNWIDPPPHDAETYKARHLVENAFADLKQYRGIANRYCKLAVMYVALAQLRCWQINTKRKQRPASPYLKKAKSKPEAKPPNVRPRQCRLWQRE